MAGWLHGVFVGEWLFVFPLCGFSLSLFCNYSQKWRIRGANSAAVPYPTTTCTMATQSMVSVNTGVPGSCGGLGHDVAVMVKWVIISTMTATRTWATICIYTPTCSPADVSNVLHGQSGRCLAPPRKAKAPPKLSGQACAGDLAGIPATQQGLWRVVQTVHTHSLRWGWLLDVPKSVVILPLMVFGKRPGCARPDAPETVVGCVRSAHRGHSKVLRAAPLVGRRLGRSTC